MFHFSCTLVRISSDDSDEEREHFYAGGAETGGSGQNVIGPPTDRAHRDLLRDLFRSAQQHGAEVVDPDQVADSSTGGSAVYSGVGVR